MLFLTLAALYFVIGFLHLLHLESSGAIREVPPPGLQVIVWSWIMAALWPVFTLIYFSHGLVNAIALLKRKG